MDEERRSRFLYLGKKDGPERLGRHPGPCSWPTQTRAALRHSVVGGGKPWAEGGYEGDFAVSFFKNNRYQLSGWEEADGN